MKISQHIRQRLVVVINDLKNVVEQKTTKTYLMNIITESLKFELEVELVDDSWMKYNNENYMINVNDSRRIKQKQKIVNTFWKFLMTRN